MITISTCSDLLNIVFVGHSLSDILVPPTNYFPQSIQKFLVLLSGDLLDLFLWEHV